MSEVELNGAKAPNGNRDSETNLGDLITDAMLWKILTQAELNVPAENVVAITNGGGIRATVKAGDITKKDINTVLPFGNTLAVVYVTGAELLEALEASTYCTPESIGGFPQAAGLQFVVLTDREYDAKTDPYPGSTYYGPATINRVEIASVNGCAFDPDAKYAVVTNNFVAGGGDTYYAFAAATDQFDTGLPLDEVVMEYITEELGGVVGEEYAEPAGRILVTTTPKMYYLALTQFVLDEEAYTPESYAALKAADAKMEAAKTAEEQNAALLEAKAAVQNLQLVDNTFADAQSGWYKPAVDFAQASGLMSGVGGGQFAPGTTTTRAMVAQVLYEAAGAPDVDGLTCPLTDVQAGQWYTDAVIWAYNAGIISGRGDGTFCPNDTITRQEMAVMFYGWITGGESVIGDEDIALAISELKDGVLVADWAREAVAYCYLADIMVGSNGCFDPAGKLDRAQLAQVFCSFYEVMLNLVLNEIPDAPEQPTEPTAPTLPTLPTAA